MAVSHDAGTKCGSRGGSKVGEPDRSFGFASSTSTLASRRMKAPTLDYPVVSCGFELRENNQ